MSQKISKNCEVCKDSNQDKLKVLKQKGVLYETKKKSNEQDWVPVASYGY